MRLLTRSDFDGLACAVLLVEVGVVDDYKFVHPKDLQDGLVEVDENDVLANVPFVPGCGLWFDHHSSERERLGIMEKHDFEGSSMIVPSCARVIYDYYGGAKTFAKFDENGMMEAVDKCDSGQLAMDDILRPDGWVMLSYLMDPRTGLGYHKDYRVSNYSLMADLIQYCRTMSAEHILTLPDVVERVDRYYAQEEAYEAMLRRCAHTEGNVLVLHLLDEDELAPGNRFKEYALWPGQNISLRIFWGQRRENVVFSCGHSILNRSSQTNVGELMLHYGGGGHTRVGTCQVPISKWKQVRNELIEAMREDHFEGTLEALDEKAGKRPVHF
jgi:nanoRNase/pAp phosphatase (c-di-AMP/oligoRNAs hydrolase)